MMGSGTSVAAVNTGPSVRAPGTPARNGGRFLWPIFEEENENRPMPIIGFPGENRVRWPIWPILAQYPPCCDEVFFLLVSRPNDHKFGGPGQVLALEIGQMGQIGQQQGFSREISGF
jgi:hypothetical protein